MRELNYFDLIEKYTNGELHEEDNAKFENELLINSELYEEFELFKRVKEQLEDEDLMSFHQMVQKVSKESLMKKPNSRKFRGAIINNEVFYFLIFFAASLAIFLFYIFYLR